MKNYGAATPPPEVAESSTLRSAALGTTMRSYERRWDFATSNGLVHERPTIPSHDDGMVGPQEPMLLDTYVIQSLGQPPAMPRLRTT